MLTVLTTFLAEAQKDIDLRPGGNFKDLGNLQFATIVQGLIGFMLIIAALVFFFMLVFGGIRWIASGGDKAQTEAARNQITAALVGLVIVFAAWAIVQLIGTFFGVELLDIKIPTPGSPGV